MIEALLLAISDPATLRLSAAMVFTFGAVIFFAVGINVYFRTKSTVRRRFMLDQGLALSEGTADQGWFKNSNSLRFQSLMSTSVLLGDVERGASSDENEASKLKREMLRAGFFGPRSVILYQVARAFLFAVAGVGGYLAHCYFWPDALANSHIMAAAFLAGIGFLLPSRVVAMRQNRVIRECRDGFPDFIDLMIVCAEAGLGPRSTIERLAREIAKTYPILGAHCYLSSLEIRAGAGLHEALLNLSRRTRVEEAAVLASLVAQTEQLGTSITNALRVYSEEMRERRLVRAEEKAHALPAKLVVPLGLFVFPVLLVVILLPAILRVRNAIL
jgi:tight adherence protein C